MPYAVIRRQATGNWALGAAGRWALGATGRWRWALGAGGWGGAGRLLLFIVYRQPPRVVYL
jgi:hypothetical protein